MALLFVWQKWFFIFFLFAATCHAWLFSSFLFIGGVSTNFDFNCDRMISRMFRICIVLWCLISVCLSCRLLVPAEMLNGCVFDPMIVSVSHAGFSINRDNCNSAIAKHIFAEQPLVYYGRARSVGVECYSKLKPNETIFTRMLEDKNNSKIMKPNEEIFLMVSFSSNNGRHKGGSGEMRVFL